MWKTHEPHADPAKDRKLQPGSRRICPSRSPEACEQGRVRVLKPCGVYSLAIRFKAASKLLTKLLNALGPQVAIIMTKFLEEEDNILIENLELVCDIAILIPFRKTEVMKRLSGFMKTSDPNTFAKVLPALRFFPLSGTF